MFQGKTQSGFVEFVHEINDFRVPGFHAGKKHPLSTINELFHMLPTTSVTGQRFV